MLNLCRTCYKFGVHFSKYIADITAYTYEQFYGRSNEYWTQFGQGSTLPESAALHLHDKRGLDRKAF
jgi:hypothetical protein